jgi:hypothetical protein
MNKFLNAKADPTNSSFRHVISYSGGTNLVGYSKKADFDEPADKRKLLCSILGRLLPGYLWTNKPSERGVVWQIEIFRRVVTTTGSTPLVNEELIGIFDDAEVELRGAFGNDRLVRSFCEVLYESRDVKRAAALIKDPKLSEGLFAFDPAGQSYQDLQSKCADLRDMNFPIGEVTRFFFAMKKRFFFEDGTPKPMAAAPANQPAAAARKRGGDVQSLSALMPTLQTV